ncbi:MAG TPA: 2-phospho-L-lactate transferase, partial [Steroidobacteraceae bacterium]
IAVNTGDDFEHLGLRISPDLDTVMYTLAGIANPVTGWGQAEESWAFMGALEKLGGPSWFRLGDRDLATHVERTQRLARGESLSAVTRVLCERLGVRHALIPMSDEPMPTRVRTDAGWLDFQHYFVREQCRPALREVRYEGAEKARPAVALGRALASVALEGVVICPSNPHLSVAPILALPGVREAVRGARPVVAVSPIVGGEAIKGPAAKIMRELGLEVSALGVARWYEGLASILVIDHGDAALAPRIEALGIQAAVTDTVMRDAAGRARLGAECISLVRQGRS